MLHVPYKILLDVRLLTQPPWQLLPSVVKQVTTLPCLIVHVSCLSQTLHLCTGAAFCKNAGTVLLCTTVRIRRHDFTSCNPQLSHGFCALPCAPYFTHVLSRALLCSPLLSAFQAEWLPAPAEEFPDRPPSPGAGGKGAAPVSSECLQTRSALPLPTQCISDLSSLALGTGLLPASHRIALRVCVGELEV